MIIKLAFAFGAGFISFLTPCVLPIIPGYISYITGKNLTEIDQDKKIVLIKTILFSLGFSLVFIALGVTASAVGNILLFLSNELNTQCKYLSQGQKQKLALSRLICSNKKIWLLDEPFSFLDNEASKNLIFEINNNCAKGGIVLIASHNDLIRDPNLVVNLE